MSDGGLGNQRKKWWKDGRVVTVQLPEGKFFDAYGRQMFVTERGAGAPLVFLHGGGPGGSGLTDFAPVLPYFEDRWAVLPDMILWGQSSKAPHNEPVWSYHAKHLDSLLEQMGITEADFVCSSQGGAAALALGAQYPHRVRRLVVSGCQPTIHVPMGKPVMPGNGKAWVADYYGDDGPTWDKCRELMAALEWYDESKVPDATVDLRLAQSLLPDMLGSARIPDGRGAREDLTEQLKALKAPVLLLWGKQDPFVRPEYAVFLSRLLSQSDVYVMDKASHHMFEEYPEAYSDIVRAFLAREGFE
jgi:2-hydroxy-6-oxonona-2,4-dienedioate hydrolase